MDKEKCVGAVVLAAGMSTRMGAPKMTLPWRGSTVLGTVLSTLAQAGVEHIRVVTGSNRTEVENVLKEARVKIEPVFNPRFANGEMMDSIRIGLENLDPRLDAVLIVLGDQPQLDARVVEGLITRHKKSGARLIVPSYQMRRGHPWLVERSLWREMESAEEGENMRTFLNRHSATIEYLVVDSDSILKDLDTPEDYQQASADR